METVIIVSVLSTLGVVALITSIVVAFIKLRKKVDVTIHDQIIGGIYRDMDTKEKDLLSLINTNNEEIWRRTEEGEQGINQQIDELRRFVDSRCDKLDNKISGKQLLTD